MFPPLGKLDPSEDSGTVFKVFNTRVLLVDCKRLTGPYFDRCGLSVVVFHDGGTLLSTYWCSRVRRGRLGSINYIRCARIAFALADVVCARVNLLLINGY